MLPTDVARSRIATEGDNSGFGPYGFLYEISTIAADITFSNPKNRLSFSPYRSTEVKTVIPGETSTL